MLIKRDFFIDQLIKLKDKKVIKVVTGIRRCGKSTIFELYQKELTKNGIKKNQIISINLEDGEYRNLKTAEELYEFVNSRLTKKKNYVFLDEIQSVNDFQKAVDWLFSKKNVDLYITGSNAFLLSGELATLLSGRYIEIKTMPLSFKEYVSAFPKNKNNTELFSEYLVNSSFPGALEMPDKQSRNAYLDGIFNSIILKDIVARQHISNTLMLENIIEYLFDNIGNISSSTNISNCLNSSGKKISVPTVETYLDALVKSFIIYKAKRYDIKGKQYLSSGYKYYIADIGLRYYLLGGNTKSDFGHVLENVVYLELVRRGYDVHVGKVGNSEVDFIAKKNEITEYFQVSQSVLEQNVLKRELAPLQAIKDHYPKNLLTMDYFPPTSYNGINQLNIINWLLE